jgi:hypothetical protein
MRYDNDPNYDRTALPALNLYLIVFYAARPGISRDFYDVAQGFLRLRRPTALQATDLGLAGQGASSAQDTAVRRKGETPSPRVPRSSAFRLLSVFPASLGPPDVL